MQYGIRGAMIAGLRRRLANLAFDRGGLIALATLLLYVWLAPSHIVDGDNAEFATLGATGGVAHPSGYPLYILWLRATSWLPGASPAHTTAIATAILGGVQVLVLHAACRAWGARATAASIAVAIFAAGPVVLRIQTEAEVFALNGLIAATVLWLAAAEGPLRGARRAAVLGLVAGLGLSNHLTCALLAPVGVLGVIRGVREAALPRPATVCLAIGGFVLGMTPYLSLFIAPDTLISWNKIDTLHGLLRHFMRSDYGGSLQFSPHGTEVPAVESLGAMIATFGRAWLWLPLVGGLATLAYHCARARGNEPRMGWAMLALTIVVSGPLLASRFNVEPEGVGLYVCQRFHILPTLLLVVPVAVGFDHAGTWLQQRSAGSAIRSRVLGGVLAVVAFFAFAGLSLPHLLAVHSPAVERGLENALQSLPPDAVVIGTSDVFHFGMGYLQGARGERPDVAIISTPQLPSKVYRERIAQRTGITIVTNSEGARGVDLAAQVLASGRPLFIDQFGASIAAEFPTYPYGLVFRVVPPGQQSPSIEEVFALNKRLFEAYELDYPIPGSDAEFATELHLQYARTWRMIAKGLAAAGRAEDAVTAMAFADALAPHD